MSIYKFLNSNYRDPLELKRSIKREFRLMLKDFCIYFIYILVKFKALLQARESRKTVNIIFRLDGLGDHIISLSALREKKIDIKYRMMYNAQWTMAIEALNINEELIKFPVDRKNIYQYFVNIIQMKALNSICLNSTPDALEVLTSLILSKKPMISLASFGNLSRIFCTVLQMIGVKFNIISADSEHDFQRLILDTEFEPNGFKSHYALSYLSAPEPAVVIMPESSDVRKDLDVNQLIAYAKKEFPNANKYLILGIMHDVPLISNDSKIIDLRGKTSLSEVISRIKGSVAYVGVDTGLMHIANLFGLELRVFIGGMHGLWFYPSLSEQTRMMTNYCPASPCNYSCAFKHLLKNRRQFNCIPQLDHVV